MAVLTANGFLAISQLPSVPQPAVVTGTATLTENVLPLRIWRLQVFEIMLALNGATHPSSSLQKNAFEGFWWGFFCLLCLIFGICSVRCFDYFFRGLHGERQCLTWFVEGLFSFLKISPQTQASVLSLLSGRVLTTNPFSF